MRCTAARMWYWTADPSAANTTSFCGFYANGYSFYYGASDDGGVAPLFVIRQSEIAPSDSDGAKENVC